MDVSGNLTHDGTSRSAASLVFALFFRVSLDDRPLACAVARQFTCNPESDAVSFESAFGLFWGDSPRPSSVIGTCGAILWMREEWPHKDGFTVVVGR